MGINLDLDTLNRVNPKKESPTSPEQWLNWGTIWSMEETKEEMW